MRHSPPRRSTLLTAAACCAVAAGLSVMPRLQQPLRAAILDIVVSGQSLALNRYESWRGRSAALALPDRSLVTKSALMTAASADDLRNLEQTCRRLRLENARLREELQLAEKYGISPIPVAASRPAVPPSVVQAALISRETLAHWHSVHHLGQGRGQGVEESALVLESGSPHLDQGSDGGIEPELDVFIGRCVVGRIASVGRWTSTLELITDVRYRALVQIVRPTDQGGSFGTEGILVGQGTEVCKLTDVPTTQTVRVGDEVYTSDRDKRTCVPLYYGRIVRVEEAGRHWDITVEPAAKISELKTVAVLKLPPSLGRPLAE
jgi:cell shape-determining protein MreC